MSKSSDEALNAIDRENRKFDFQYREYEREIEKIKSEQGGFIKNVASLLNELNNGRQNKTN